MIFKKTREMLFT